MHKISKTFLMLAVISFFLTVSVFAQKTKDSTDKRTPVIPKVIKIDDQSIKEILQPKGKPLLVNFWATWCGPCREEFPELVEIYKEYKGKIDFITISLDDLAEINRDVPKFLTEMKATMPTYLLKTNDENAVIGSISKDWTGGLPFTVLYDEKGGIFHTRQGKIKPQVVKSKIDLVLELNGLKSGKDEKIVSSKINGNDYAIDFYFEGIINIYEKGKMDAQKDVSEGKLAFIDVGIHRPPVSLWMEKLAKDYRIYVFSLGCVVPRDSGEYRRGYNEIAVAEIEKRFGKGILEKLLNQAKKQFADKVKRAQ